MSKYTTEVRYICEYYAGYEDSQDFDKIDDIIHKSHNKVMGNYPIFDEAYRETLDSKILKHYYTREICEETAALWRLRLNNRMNEIMPYYNKMYSSELLHFNPLYDVDISSSHIRNEDSSANATSKTKDNRNESKITDGETERNANNVTERNDSRASNTDNETFSENQNKTHSGTVGSAISDDNKKQLDKYSDTPQGAITGLESGTYLTNARIIEGEEGSIQNTNQVSDSDGNTKYNENGSSSTNEQYNTSGKSVDNDTTKNSVSENLNASTNGERNDENNISTTEDYLEHVQGKRGGVTYSKMLSEYRETFLNIDRMIIDELNDLFFGLWE